MPALSAPAVAEKIVAPVGWNALSKIQVASSAVSSISPDATSTTACPLSVPTW